MPEVTGKRIPAGRQVFFWAILVVLVVLLPHQLVWLADADIVPPGDFVQYWAAGKLNLRGGNPYDPQELLVLEKQAGRQEEEPVYFLNPPGTLALVMPLALLPFPVSRFFCLVLQLLVLALCTLWAWRWADGPARYNWLALVVCFTFFPNQMAIFIGQITPVLLVAILGFLQLLRRQKEFGAGLVVSLLTIKPHLLYLFWIALVFWSCNRRHWRTAAGVVVGTLCLLAAAWLPNPQLLDQYLALLANYWPQDHYLIPTVGSLLRLGLGWEYRWLQNVPAVLGIMWFVPYYFSRQRAGWNWDRELPLLILISCLTTFYGAWISDLIVLVLPLLQLFAWVLKESHAYRLGLLLAGHFFLNGVIQVINRVGLSDVYMVWITPTLLFGYVWLARRYRRLQLEPGEI